MVMWFVCGCHPFLKKSAQVKMGSSIPQSHKYGWTLKKNSFVFLSLFLWIRLLWLLEDMTLIRWILKSGSCQVRELDPVLQVASGEKNYNIKLRWFRLRVLEVFRFRWVLIPFESFCKNP